MAATSCSSNCSASRRNSRSCCCSNTDTYVEPLDSTRIHPETYDWARKMAVDALEYDDTAEDANPAGALEEILDSPDRLKDLDLDAFAVELERQVSHTHSCMSVCLSLCLIIIICGLLLTSHLLIFSCLK